MFKDICGCLALLVSIGILAGLVIISCGKPPAPGPTPDPLTDFVIKGQTVTLEGRLKPGALVTVEGAKLFFKPAVDMMDRN